MSNATRSLAGGLVFAGLAAAQGLPTPRTLTLPEPISAGTFFAASGQFVPAAQLATDAPVDPVIFKSNYYTARFYDIDDGTVIYDEGRVPSPTSPTPMTGLEKTSYRVTGMQIAYATDSTTPVSMRLRMWHSYLTCSDPSTLPAPIADITLTGMPGTINPGSFTPYTFDVDMTGREFCLLADGDGTYGNGQGEDRFGWALEVLDGGNGTETGPIVSGRPGTPFAPVLDGTVFQNPGAIAGSGLGQEDQWFDVGPGTLDPANLEIASNRPGTFLDISTTGTALVFPNSDDGQVNIVTTVGNSLLPAGNVRVSTNGGIRFFGGGAPSANSLSTVNAAIPGVGGTIFGGGQVLLPFWDDLLTAGAPNYGNVFWQEVAGTLIIQWENIGFFGTGGGVGGDRATFQVQIPSSGPIYAQFLYADLMGTARGNGASATIGYQSGGGLGLTNEQFSFNPPMGAVSNGTVLSLVNSTLPGSSNCYNWGGYDPIDNDPPTGSFWLVINSDLTVDCTGCQNGIDDGYEDNDTCATASPVMAPAVITNLVATSTDEDYYQITIPANTRLTARIDFLHAQADVDMELFDLGCGASLAGSFGVTNSEEIAYFNCGATPVDVVLNVYLFSGSCADYALTTTFDGSCNIDDLLEDNDSCAQTFPLSLGFTPNLRIKACDEDYYYLDADPGETINIGAFFTGSVANLDLYLYYQGANCGSLPGLLTQGTNLGNDEFLVWTNTTGQVQNYVLHVDYASSGSGNCQTYAIAYTRDPSTEIGFQFCTAVQNSTGRGAHIFATGSDVRADNDVTLGCRYLPSGSNGYFLNSRTQIFVPFPGGSVGNLCIGGGAVGRYNANVLSTGMGDTVSLVIDLGMIPRPTGFESALVGQTWNFQYWYRDIGGVSNFSDAVGITFN